MERRTFLKAAVASGAAAAGGYAIVRAVDDSTGAERSRTADPEAKRRGPNVLLVVADDMRWDELDTMPHVAGLVVAQGTTFTSCRPEVSVCTPARAGLLSGQHSKDHGVLTQADHPANGHRDTVAAWLAAEGVHCSMVGKYVVGFAREPKPGWAHWRVLVDEDFESHGYVVSDGSRDLTPDAHVDEYLTQATVDHLQARAKVPDVAWFCSLNPTAPHWPLEPQERFAGHVAAAESTTVDDREDVTSKPSWIRARPTVSEWGERRAREVERTRREELAGLDQMVADVVGSLQELGQLEDTIIVFTSDNGLMLGEHRWPLWGKGTPYDESLHVPLVVRGPGFPPASTVDVPCQHQDITAMLVAAHGAEPSVGGQVGIDLRRLAAEPAAHVERAILHTRSESPLGNGSVDVAPAATGVTTSTRKLWRYADGGSFGRLDPTDRYEMYDLDTDPSELRNVANDPDRRDERDALERRLDSLRAG